MTAAAALHDGDFRATGMGGSTEKEFPCQFGMFRSPGSNDSDEDEFFASLTQRLTLSQPLLKSPEGLKLSGGSPQSTLGGIESWSSNVSNHNSPPATPFESRDDTLGLIYAAAGQVARLERNAEDPLQAALNGQWRAVAKPNPHQNQKAGFYAEMQMKHNYMAAVQQAYEAALSWEQHLRIIKGGSDTCCNSRYGPGSQPLNQSAWPPLQQARVGAKHSFQAVPSQRKESAGTGVFIPRIYDSSPAVPPSKRTVAPCALVPAKVVQALNTSIETMSVCSRPHCSTISSAAASVSQQSCDALMSRRRAFLDQQQRSMARTDDIASRSLEACLPQEWSY